MDSLTGFSLARGVYSFTGTPAAVTAALQGLVYQPTANFIKLGNTATVTFALAVSDNSGGKVATGTKAPLPPSIVITPVDDAPTGVSLTQVANLKGPVAAGKEVGVLSPTDPDGSTDTYTYSLVSGGTNNADFTFGTGTKSNELVVATGKTLAAGTYSILVQVSDSSGKTFQKALSVTVS